MVQYCLFYIALSFFSHLTFANMANTQKSTERWQQIEHHARLQTVYFHAWGGDPQINSYIQWVAKQVNEKYQINLVHVKLADTSEAVSRVLAEKAADNNTQGSVDLIWINGANFATMSEHSLLLSQWANYLPNFKYTDPNNNPAVTYDFGIATNGMESPWGQSSLTFYYDSATIKTPPETLNALLKWSENNPGRFSYPKPSDYLGMSFLKYALTVLHQHSSDEIKNQLNQVVNAKTKDKILAPLWQFLDTLHPTLWRKGSHFMQSSAQMRRLIDDTELSLAFTFSSAEIPAAVARYDLIPSIRSYAMADGSLSNTHFVAIPYNASHAPGAQVVANFLLSPAAQAYKQRPEVWGDKTVLIQHTLAPKQQALFTHHNTHPSALPIDAIKRTLNEPHPSWVKAIQMGWQARYGVSQ
ncbi:ABC transporter substrate-binding protein [Pseudoalteromonas sp. MMG010]|uniref:ABC transporter substrate-binding protein n=1 Tax=Pseudoalteromonas sp. MMG010 TaxID=2822685 RepID=UPI0024941276|nr:ABC transporter substrate-binding protein [Pseudoalteromonas sp. MMG010]